MKSYAFGTVLFACVFCNLFCYAQTGTIHTFAGNGTAGYTGDGGLATAAKLNSPTDVYKDALGNFYIADRGNNRIRKINTSGIISTIAGNGTAGYTGDGGQATAASLNGPNRVFVDGTGNIYIADESNHVIRMINTSGIISTIVGTGASGASGDGGPATSATLNNPTGVAVDLTGNIFISDNGGDLIRKVNTAGIISTYAGGGAGNFTTDGVPATSISLCGQNYVSVDNAGTIYITNYGCYHFLKVTSAGLIYNVAGFQTPAYSGDCGPADSANVEFPYGITPDNLGNVYVCPRGNIRVRRVNTSNYITTVAGTGTSGYTGDGGPATSAEVSSSIYGIYADMIGNVYFADEGNNVIRTFTSTPFTDSISLCTGGMDTLTSTGTGTWSSNNTAVATVGATTGIVTGVSSGNATITFYNGACPELVLVTVNAPVITGGSVCVGSTLALNGGSGNNGTWSSDNTAVATVNNTGVVTGVAPGTATITYSLPGGCFATATVTVVSAPSTITGDTTVCPGATITLSDTAAGGTWSSNAPGIATVASGSGVVAGVAPGTAIISYNTGSGCIAMTTITVMPLPNAGTITGPSSLCAEATIALSDTTSGGTWSTGAPGVAIVSASGIVTGVSAGTVIISYAVTNSCGITTATKTITVDAADTTYHNIDTVACAATGPITLNGPAGYSAYLWNTGSTASYIIVATPGVYIDQATSGCNLLVDTITLHIIANNFTIFNNDTAVCRPTSIQINALGDSGLTYTWLPTIGVSNYQILAPLLTPDTSENYIITATYPGCPPAVHTLFIDVQPNPSVYLAGSRFVCQFDTVHLNAIVTPWGYPNYIYTWTPSTQLTDTTTPDAVYTEDSTGTFIIVLKVSTSAGCHSEDSSYVTVYPGQFATLLPANDTAICPGDSVQFIASGAALYQWSPGSSLSDSATSNPVAYPTATQNYNLIATSQYGCHDTFNVNIVVHPAALLSLGDSITLYPGQSYQMNARGNCLNYSWFPPLGLSATNISNPIASPGVDTKYIVNAATEWGCTTVDSIIVHVDSNTLLALPNAFTPGNGPNNELKIIKQGIATLHYFRVFNRWGNKVFEASDIDDGWDGAYKGTPQPFGVYVYEVEAETSNGRRFYKQGNVTLLR